MMSFLMTWARRSRAPSPGRGSSRWRAGTTTTCFRAGRICSISLPSTPRADRPDILRVTSFVRGRYPEPERGPAAFLALDPDRAPVLQHERLADREPEPRAAPCARRRLLYLMKRLEDQSLMIDWHPRAHIDDPELHLSLPALCADLHRAPLRRELD